MMGKKRVVIPLLVLGLLVLALMLAYFERRAIATYAAKDYLAGLGIEDPRLEFTDLTFTHIEVEGVALGGPEGVNARTIRLDFAFLGEGLLPDALDLRQVEIEGLRLQLNLTGQGELLPGLQPLLARTEDEEEARTGLIAFDPLSDDFAVALTDSRLVIQTDQGPINALLDSQIDRDDEGGMKVRVVGGGEGPGGRADGEARLTFQDEALTFAEADLHLSDFALADLDPEALYVSLQADAYSLAVHGDLLLPDAHLGGFALLQSKEAIVPLSEPPGDLYALKTILLDQDWELQGQLSGQNLSHPTVGQGLTFSTSLDLTKEDRTWRLHLPEETKVTVDRLAASLLEGDLPPDLTRFLSNPFEISLSGPKDAPLLFGRGEASATSPLPTSLNIKGDASFLSALAASLNARLFGNLTYDINTPSYHIDITSLIEALNFNIGGYGSGNVGYRGRIEAAPGVLALNGTLEGLDWRAEAEGMPARITTAGTPVRARLKDDSGRLHLGSGLTIEMSDQTLPFDTPTGLVTATLRSMTAKAPLSGPGTLEETLEATAELELAGGTLLISETAVRHAPLQASFTHEGGKTELLLGGASLEFPALGIRLNQPVFSGYAKGDDRAVDLTAGLVDIGGGKRFPPLNGRLIADLSDFTRIPLSGSFSGLNNRLQIALNGAYAVETGALTFAAKANPLLFVPGGVQPGQLHPVLEAMEETQGELRAEANVRISNGNLSTDGVISLKNASFSTPLGSYSGFNSEITLTSLWPPRTDPGQTVTVEAISIEEFPLSNFTGRFHLTSPEDPELSAGLPDVAIEEASLTFAEGRMRVRDMRIRPLSENQDSVIEVESLDLSKFFELLDIEDVAASGRMSGVIPLSLRGDAVLIDGAYLAADGPGVLNIKSAEAQAALLPADDYIGELVDALEDFRYEILTIGISKPLAGDTLVTMRILGKNPEVLHGTSFDLNVNLETDLAPVLEALRQAQALRRELESGFIEGVQ